MTLRSPTRVTRPVGTASAASCVVVVTLNVWCLHAPPPRQLTSMQNTTKERRNNITDLAFIMGSATRALSERSPPQPLRHGLAGPHVLRRSRTRRAPVWRCGGLSQKQRPCARPSWSWHGEAAPATGAAEEPTQATE